MTEESLCQMEVLEKRRISDKSYAEGDKILMRRGMLRMAAAVDKFRSNSRQRLRRSSEGKTEEIIDFKGQRKGK